MTEKGLEKKIDHRYTHALFCPHCGDEKTRAWEWTDEGGIHDCGKCLKKYTWERHITIEFSSYKITHI